MGSLRAATFKPGDWVYFCLFTAANAFLSYSRFSFEVKGWFLLAGLVFPAALFLISTAPAPPLEEPVWRRDSPFFHFSGPAGWALIIILSLFLRFYKLDSFHLWPAGDEGLHGFFALDLVRKWDWQYFYTVGEHPPLLIWILGLCFKISENPFFNLWFLPACLSALGLFFSYFAARLFFPKPLSLLCTLLMAFSFWPLYFGRFCHQGTFLPFWELAGLFLLGMFCREKNPGKGRVWLAALGLWTGLGSLTFPSWAVIAVLLTLTVGWSVFQRPSGRIGRLSAFLFPFLVGLLPFIIAVFREGYGHHLLDTSAAGGMFPPGHAWVTHLSYITALFWGSLQSGTSYGPSWGGMLNPLLASCFLVGFLELCRERRKPFPRWMFLAFGLCLLPGLVAADYVELNRVIQVMPLLLLTAAIGAQKLLEQTARPQRPLILGLLLALSFGLDTFHLFKPALDFSGPLNIGFKKEIPDQNFRAYQVLNAADKKWGPGLIFTDFLLLSRNHSLYVATYPFNAASNPKWEVSQAKWAAILANVHYGPFLLKRFPQMRWVAVGRDLSEDGGMAVGIVPVTPENRSVFERWVKVHGYFHRLNREAEDILNNKTRYAEALQRLPSGYEIMERDPFLISIFGEWVAQYHFDATYGKNVQAIETAIDKGYPAAHLFYKLGNFSWLNKDFTKAGKAYKKSCRLEPDDAVFRETLRVFENMNPKPWSKP